MHLAEEIGLKWAKRIAKAYLIWAESEQKSRTIDIKPFDPETQITLAFYEAGESQLIDIGKLIGAGVKFDLRSKEAEAWIKDFSAKEIKYINSANRAAIRQIKLRAFQEGLTIQEQRVMIKEFIGLLPKHVIAVGNYKDGLLKSGMDEATAQRLAAKYREKLLRYRANMIAETEGMSASNEGIRQTNLDAVKRGIISKDEYEMEWVASGLRNVCSRCQDANGKRAPIGGKFPNGSMGPPIHPHDHCGTVLVRKHG
jgi:hypothetical protein